MGRIFGTDGARGVANTELTCKLAFDIGRASAMVLAEELHRPPVFLIGKDTRVSSDMLEAAISAGICSVGGSVTQLGVVPTPAVAYLVTELGADAGVMLSASHNPYEYNGIKLFGSEGYKLTDEEEFRIEDIILDENFPYTAAWGSQVGVIRRDETAVQRYIEHLASTVSGSLRGLRVAVDCSNGSASTTAAALFGKLGAEVTLLSCEPNGININRGCGSTHIEALAAEVKKGGYDAGIAFDGDADRCLAVDADGALVDGDRIIAILALDRKQRGCQAGDAAVVTVMSNLGFFRFCEANGIQAPTTKVGDRYVLECMREKGYALGGEQSGHVILSEYMPTGDGQLTAIQLLDVMHRSGKSLSALASVMTVYPQVMVNLRADSYMKSHWSIDEGVLRCIDQHKEALGGDGRILVRASGTEPLIRVMVEGKDETVIKAVAEDIAATIEERLSNNESIDTLD